MASSQAKFILIILIIVGAALVGGFFAVQFFLPQVSMPHQQGIQATQELNYPVSFRSMGTIHNAEMRYGSFPVASYLWEFGDGETSSESNPTHRYTQAGTYTVRITITSTDGKTYTDTQEVEVK